MSRGSYEAGYYAGLHNTKTRSDDEDFIRGFIAGRKERKRLANRRRNGR